MDYIIYRDHIGWVLTTSTTYERLVAIHAAMRQQTWGDFLAALPEDERRRLVETHRDLLCADLLPRGMAEDEDAELASDTPFSREQIRGFDEGDYPPWPADVSQFADGTCTTAYERFGERGSGFVHTFSHIQDHLIQDLITWLGAQGHTLRRRESPSS